jgi:ArsR family transcriptional regulator
MNITLRSLELLSIDMMVKGRLFLNNYKHLEKNAQLRYSATMHVITINPETLFQALSDNTRLRIVRLLATTNQEICLCELVDALQEPQYKLSRHLKALRQAGLLTSQKDGRWVYHRLAEDPDYLQQLYTMVRSLPDSNESFNRDVKRFNDRMRLREEGRCRVGILSDDLKARVK